MNLFHVHLQKRMEAELVERSVLVGLILVSDKQWMIEREKRITAQYAA